MKKYLSDDEKIIKFYNLFMIHASYWTIIVVMFLILNSK